MKASASFRLVAPDTGEAYAPDAPRWRSASGALLDLDIQPVFDPDLMRRRPPGMWRYLEALPLLDPDRRIELGETATPLVPLRLDGQEVHVKLDYLFPSGSYKDRGAALLISHARALGIGQVVQDSSGNAGCAVAQYCAAAGIACDIFVPGDTSPSKLRQIAAYGAQIRLVPGTREDTAAAALQAAASTYYASHVWNPFFLHGTKTFAYELCEQLDWQAPDTVVLPAGNGTLLLGCEIGFRELYAAGLIGHVPALVGVQALACAPLIVAQAPGTPGAQPAGPTLAEGIAIAAPRRQAQMLAAATGGLVGVSEAAIADTLRLLCGMGYFVEPTSAAVIAGVRQYLAERARPGERIATVLTGHGLKAADKIAKMLEMKDMLDTHPQI
ncbi:MAG: pyridoxal-phosphate dependent enzyme [Bacteroidia bacterium]